MLQGPGADLGRGPIISNKPNTVLGSSNMETIESVLRQHPGWEGLTSTLKCFILQSNTLPLSYTLAKCLILERKETRGACARGLICFSALGNGQWN